MTTLARWLAGAERAAVAPGQRNQYRLHRRLDNPELRSLLGQESLQQKQKGIPVQRAGKAVAAGAGRGGCNAPNSLMSSNFVNLLPRCEEAAAWDGVEEHKG
jgi:hypothetical protein